MLSLISSEKSFSDRWVGSRFLNLHKAHRRRMAIAEQCASLRRLMAASWSSSLPAVRESLAASGYAVVPNFLDLEAFTALSNEVEAVVADVEARRPISNDGVEGFGRKISFEGGVDRFDGDTLNRFIDIDAASMPHAAAFARNGDVSALTRAVVGVPHPAWKTQIYVTAHGAEDRHPDIQKLLHRDTFFSAMKFWYFLRPVRDEDGPFAYVPGSHRLDDRRLAWEQSVADDIFANGGRHPNASGSFRIDEADLPKLGFPSPVSLTCEANTLVIANVLGFHRRGHAADARRRLAIYGWERPYPFGLVGH
jgi:hypothetical protein